MIFFIKKNNIQKTSESEDSGDYHDSEEDYFKKDPNEEKKTKHEFILKYIIPQQINKKLYQ